jgi:gamma-glutamyltranspeptidase/glutathione hydrolase
LKTNFRGLTIHSRPPPGAGRTLFFTLNMLNLIAPEILGENQQVKYYLLAEIFRKALLERSDRPFDPNFYPQLHYKEKKMLNRRFASRCLKSILKRVDRTIIASIASEDEFSGETTHLSVIDKNGMAVSLTQSIERVYGSKAAAEGLGFLYNNYLQDFEYKEIDHPFYLRPNGVPWATVAPSLVFKENDIWIAMGSPGSERIFSTLSQFLIHLTDNSYSLDKAMESPRLHCSMGGRISLEADRFPDRIINFLGEKGYRIDRRESLSFYLGCVQAVLRCRSQKGFQGVADVRRDGTAAGY